MTPEVEAAQVHGTLVWLGRQAKHRDSGYQQDVLESDVDDAVALILAALERGAAIEEAAKAVTDDCCTTDCDGCGNSGPCLIQRLRAALSPEGSDHD
jgi:hypothetical protein